MVRTDVVDMSAKNIQCLLMNLLLWIKACLKRKKRNLQIEKIEILARYEVDTAQAFEDKIKEGNVPEYPSWEDLIEIQNIDVETKEIESDITFLQRS